MIRENNDLPMSAEDLIKRWFHQNEWDFKTEFGVESSAVRFKTKVPSESEFVEDYELHLVCRDNKVFAYFHSPMLVPERARTEVARYLAEISELDYPGRLTLDLEVKGYVSYRTSFPDWVLSERLDEVMTSLVREGVAALDKHLVPILRISLEEISPSA